MTDDEIVQKTAMVIRAFLKPETPDLLPEEKLRDRFDSLTVMEMMFRFEDEFKITIDDQHMHTLVTYSDLVRELTDVVRQKESGN